VHKLTRNWPLVSLLAAILITIAVASASYWLIERPILGLKARFSPTKPKMSMTQFQTGESPVLASAIPASAFSSSNLVAESVAEAKK
jgi:peptidoglycan/LPS O-acetylase OafA/YrhL